MYVYIYMHIYTRRYINIRLYDMYICMYGMDIRIYRYTYTYQKVTIKYLKGTNFRGGNVHDFVPTSEDYISQKLMTLAQS